MHFEDGGNLVGLVAIPGQTLPRMQLDGVEWAAGAVDEPEVSGSTVTWSGPMGTEGAEPQQDVEMTFNC